MSGGVSRVIKLNPTRRLSHFQRAAGGEPPKESDEQPLRSELFSTDQLEQHAKSLAGWHEVDKRTGPDRLLSRLEKNEAVLLEAYQLIVAAVAAERISPADEWLLDNFYLIEIRTAPPFAQELQHAAFRGWCAGRRAVTRASTTSC